MKQAFELIRRQAYIDDPEWSVDPLTGCMTQGKLKIFSLELFAELIVKECIAQIESVNDSSIPIQVQGGLALAQVSLKEHFGVE